MKLVALLSMPIRVLLWNVMPFYWFKWMIKLCNIHTCRQKMCKCSFTDCGMSACQFRASLCRVAAEEMMEEDSRVFEGCECVLLMHQSSARPEFFLLSEGRDFRGLPTCCLTRAVCVCVWQGRLGKDQRWSGGLLSRNQSLEEEFERAKAAVEVSRTFW